MAGTAAEDEKAISDDSIHTVWIHGRPAENGSHNYCMKAFLSMKTNKKQGKDDILFLYHTKEHYSKSHLKYLCDLSSFSFDNIHFTNGKYGTLWDDIANTKELSLLLENIILESYKSKKYDKLFIRCADTYYVGLDWINKLILKHNYLSKYISIEMEKVSWVNKFGNKSILHPKWKDWKIKNANKFEVAKGGIIAESLKIAKYFKLCKGFIVYTKEELIEAYDYFLKYYKISDVLIKDCFGRSGKGITFVSNKQDVLNYEMDNVQSKTSWKRKSKNGTGGGDSGDGDDADDTIANTNVNVILNGGCVLSIEENLCKTVSNDCDFLGMHYSRHNSNKLKTKVYGPTNQILVNQVLFIGGGSYPLTLKSSQTSDECDGVDDAKEHRPAEKVEATSQLKRLLEKKFDAFVSSVLKPQSQGGFDVYINNKNKMNDIYLIDINTCRATATVHYCNFIENHSKLYDYGKKEVLFLYTRIKYPSNYLMSTNGNTVNFDKILSKMKSDGILFDKSTGIGVLPVMLCKYSIIMEFGIFDTSENGIDNYYSKLIQMFNNAQQNNYQDFAM